MLTFAACSEALQNGQLSGSGPYDIGDNCLDLGRAYTAPEPLPDPFMIAAEVGHSPESDFLEDTRKKVTVQSGCAECSHTFLEPYKLSSCLFAAT